MGDLRLLYIYQFFQHGGRLWTSESDVCRRQILTSKVGPRAERVRLINIIGTRRASVGHIPNFGLRSVAILPRLKPTHKSNILLFDHLEI